MNTENYFKMLKSRPYIDEVTWQREALLSEELQKQKKALIAAGTSSGKSIYITMDLELFYMTPANKNKKSLFIPSGQTNLRLNIEETFEFFKPTFSYVIAKTCEELETAMNSDIQVIVCLPQTVINCVEVLPKLDKFILDEAHTWYFQKTIKTIIKKAKPTQQILLTGTPAPFILKGGFYTHFVPVIDLYDEGRISNTEIHVVASDYDFKGGDYNSDDNLTLDSRAKMSLASEKALKKVILGMIRKLNNPIKSLKNVNRLTNDIVGIFFNYLSKTIIWASSIQQANKFAEVLRTFTGLENAVLVSHSKNDDDSQLMERFKEDKNIKILVTVNRGRMGWSYTELFNAVDFTMTRNLSSILQMLARLFRISKTNPSQKKIFYKVSNSKDAGYFTVIMKGVLLLLEKEWYSKFNGKNFNSMKIPVTVPRRPNPNVTPGKKQPGRPRTKHNYEMIDLPLDMDFFKTVYSKQDDNFSTVAWTTLGEVRAKFLNKQYYRTNRSLEDCYNEMKNYKTLKQFRKNDYKAYIFIIVQGDREKMYKFFKVEKKISISLEDRINRMKTFNSYTEWTSAYRPDVSYIKRYKGKELFEKHFSDYRKEGKKPTEERIATMKTFSNYTEWHRVYTGDYNYIRKNHNDIMIKHFNITPIKKLTIEDCTKTFVNSNTFTDWRKNNKSEYSYLSGRKQINLAKEYFQIN